MNRVDITGKLASELRCDALLVVGSKSSQCAAAEYMHSHMDKVGYIYFWGFASLEMVILFSDPNQSTQS